ncbi:MAG: lytic transglycosylase domain-containing protein [Cognatishimia sp.]|uniref:lytic transglycosylase domain-containing protein n=1 Tax=Cognatishimia sp. TaxID=2211648 RepID=UPI003B8E0BD6
MRGPLLAYVIAVCVAATSVQADLFGSLFTSPKAVEQSLPDTKNSALIDRPTTGAQCVAAILDAEQRYDIPGHLLLAIGIQEAGRNGPAGLAVWPWTVNANGEGAFFPTREAAQDWVREKQAQGINSIDVGCMQINLRWHGEQFPHQDAAFDPFMNVDYAARFLVSLFHETGAWDKAAGRYHSATEKHQRRYLDSLGRNRQVVGRDIQRLTALARSFVPVEVAEVVIPPAPPPPVFWSSSESGGYSIYSNAPIRPILPQYEAFF